MKIYFMMIYIDILFVDLNLRCIYDKNNSKIMAMILKAKYEYKMTYDKLKMKYIFNFIKNRLKKRKIRKKVEK